MFGKLLKGVSKIGSLVNKTPLGNVAKMIPGVGTVVGAIGLAGGAASAISAFRGGGGGGLPALPSPGGTSLPAVMASPSAAMMGERSIFRNDPNVIEQLKPFAIPMRGLRTYFRAPKGFVVLRDQVGDPYGVPRQLARQFGLWKPAKKPLLSIRDTNAIRRAGSAIKKLQNAEKMAKRIANWKSPRRAAACPPMKGGKKC